MSAFDPSPLTIDKLNTGVLDPILVVDFLQFSAGPRLSDILASRSQDHPVYLIDPVTDLSRDRAFWPLDNLADGYAELCRQRDLARDRLAIVGYCSAAALAGLLAARLSATADIGFVLVEPTWPDEAMVAADFTGFRTALGAEPTAHPPGATEVDADPRLALKEMIAILEGDLRAMAARHGLDHGSQSLSDLLERYRAWLGFLLASSDPADHLWPAQIRPRVLRGADSDAALAASVLASAWQR